METQDADPRAADRPPATDVVAVHARDGDRDSQDVLFRRIAPAIYAWARLHVKPPLRARLDPEDVLQEVACRAFARFDAWDPARGSFRGFAFGIAKNVLLKALERLAKDPAAARMQDSGAFAANIAEDATSLSRAVARDDSLAKLVDRLELLPEDDRRLLLHRGLEGLSHDEVGRIFHLSADAIAKRWQRLCDRLREEPRFQDIVAA